MFDVLTTRFLENELCFQIDRRRMSMKTKSQIFLSYASEDREKVNILYQKLNEAGFKPWMDINDLLPGQEWRMSIQKAIQESDFILACLSRNSVDRTGFIHVELNYALDIWQEKLDNDIFLIPARLENCAVPRILADFQYVDLFEKDGWAKLIAALRIGMERQKSLNAPIIQEEKILEQTPFDNFRDINQTRGAARASQIEMDARRLERCETVEAISRIHQKWAVTDQGDSTSALLRGFGRTSQDVDAALHQESAYNRRLALRAVEERLDGLILELKRSKDSYTLRFRPIAKEWRRIIADHVQELTATVKVRQEIDNPYVFGVPLTVQQELFVGRTDISARIEQLLLDRRRPPLLLYGQRRMGKTSLLNNLGRLLPSTIVPLFVDLQGPASQAQDHAGFLYNISRGMVDSAQRQRNLALPTLTRETLATDPFTSFDEWLDEVEKNLGENTALLALDEFETLDRAFSEGRFTETAVLGWLRHLIQHRPRFKVLLAGSHTLDELQRWASYLINVQVVQISYLKESEARQLIEKPVQDFALRYEPKASRRVLELTRCHPALIQLLCAEIVALKNEQDPAVRRLAKIADVEAAVPNALKHGSFFFADIERNQIDADSLALLRFMAAQGEGAVVDRKILAQRFPDKLDHHLAALTKRELIEAAPRGYRFQVELIRCWFAPKLDSTNGVSRPFPLMKLIQHWLAHEAK